MKNNILARLQRLEQQIRRVDGVMTILRLDGSLVGQTSGKVDNETHYTKEPKENPYTLVSLHNRGTNLPPSGSDFTNAGYKKYAFGVAACHNGEVYTYSIKDAKPFVSDGLDKRVDKFVDIGYNIFKAYEAALNEATSAYGIEWRCL